MAPRLNEVELRERVLELVSHVDLEKTSIKEFMKILSHQNNGECFKDRKKFIKGVISDMLNNPESSSVGYAVENSQVQAVKDEKPKRNVESKKSKTGKHNFEDVTGEVDMNAIIEPGTDRDVPPIKPGTRGLNQERLISKPLRTLLRIKEIYSTRPRITKLLWNLIRDEELQDPDDGRNIVLNEDMQRCFGVRQFTSFEMATFLSCHFHPFTPLNEAVKKIKKKEKNAPDKKRKALVQGPTKKKVQKRRPNKLSPELSLFVGREYMPRTKVTQFIWKYIKKHKLQNPKDRREIICDDVLKKLLGVNKVNYFKLAKYLNLHIHELCEMNLYWGPNGEDPEEDKSDCG